MGKHTITAVILACAYLFMGTWAHAGDFKLKPGGKVGVSLTSKSFQRWVMDGDNLKKYLTEKGYQVDLQYANNEPQTQINQIENMITTGCEVLIIAPVDNGALSSVLATAKAANVLVINYDLMILNTPDIDYFVGFDNRKVGVIQANYIIKKLGLDQGKGPFNIELFAGSLDENNSFYYYDGAMATFKPYFDNGKLVVKSGQTNIEKITIPGWAAEKSIARMDNLITTYYSDGTPLDAVHIPADSLAVPACTALKNVGYGEKGKPFPVVTGNDATIGAVMSIINGEMSMSVFKDTRLLAKKAVDIVDAVANRRTLTPDDTSFFDNGKKTLPAFLCDMEALDLGNYKKLVLDSGYYTEEQLKIKK